MKGASICTLFYWVEKKTTLDMFKCRLSLYISVLNLFYNNHQIY